MRIAELYKEREEAAQMAAQQQVLKVELAARTEQVPPPPCLPNLAHPAAITR